MALGSNRNVYQEYFLGGYRRPVRRADKADCLEIWEPQPPGTLRASPRPVIGLLYLYLYN